MRWISMLTAVLVTLSLYLLLMQRDRVMAFAGAEPVAADVQTPATEAERRVSVVVQKSAAQQVQGAVRVRGETRAARQVEVRAETSGRVISEPLRKGATVAEGDTLCRLDPGTRESTLAQAEAALAEARARLPVARATVTQAEAQLDEARINDRAARRLAEGGFASDTRVAGTQSAVSAAEAALVSAQAGLETAQTAIRTAEANVATARKEIERLTITAPFAGLLDDDAAELGALLQPGALCATVIQLDPIHLVGYVPETELDLIETGALAGGRFASGREVMGRVSYVARTADEATRTFRVEIEVENAKGTIRAGQTVEIGIVAPAETAHLVPQSALTLDDQGRLGVRLADDGVARFAPISVLRDTIDGFWVTGLPDLAEVIVVGQEFVTDGVPIAVTYRETPE
ncbi:efflux RND transporter periplasmic adaptor subunit [Rhodovulum marinum]|uniref:Multidrug efflux system membrane fusion protein n=1 Tax=Rhodovulum marinum TaxID=320662 RepID=A0A4R2Q1A1_9RHOB|nr:efflux RND transporter periplasmic adaptor subunit [Rhodovulum marinum]TCP42392.1 multidrug efflux system membrane fusion protein [Rhodovulum marinum]